MAEVREAVPQGWLSRFTTKGWEWLSRLTTKIYTMTAVISGLVAWLVSTGLELQKSGIERDRLNLDYETSKVEIIKLIDDRNPDLALVLIKYYQKTYGERDQNFKILMDDLEEYINTTLRAITRQPDQSITQEETNESITILNSDAVRVQFNSSNRRRYAEYMVALYNEANQDERKKIVSSLLDSILDKDIDGLSKYRVNLYIALTFALLPRVELTRDQAAKFIKSLKESPEYKRDETFRLNVNNAMAKQGLK